MLMPLVLVTRLSLALSNISSRWEKLTNDPEFHYRNSKEAIENIQQPKANIFNELIVALIDFFTSPAGKFIGWVLFFILIAWALFKIFFSDAFSLLSKKSKTIDETADESVEQTLVNTNWEYYLNQAVQGTDTRLTIRYSFMRLLQLLQMNGLIHFEESKTNADYYHELSKTDIKQDFRQLSKQYEYAWYGQFIVSDEAYNDYMRIFNDLKHRLYQS